MPKGETRHTIMEKNYLKKKKIYLFLQPGNIKVLSYQLNGRKFLIFNQKKN